MAGNFERVVTIGFSPQRRKGRRGRQTKKQG
jgi:hypothetical protein